MKTIAFAVLLWALFATELYAIQVKRSLEEPKAQKDTHVTVFELYEPGSVSRARGIIRVRNLGESFNFSKARLSVPEKSLREIQVDAKK